MQPYLNIFLSTLSLRRATRYASQTAAHMIFLSTLSLRRATQIVLTLVSKLNEFLSTLSLRRATIARCLQGWHKPISIHALLAESDLLCAAGWAALKISIHALLAESDRARAAEGASARNFYPRSPCGERRALWGLMCCTSVFLSTLSLRRATAVPEQAVPQTIISIHALLAESDKRGLYPTNKELNFYPRSPCGERPNGLL